MNSMMKKNWMTNKTTKTCFLVMPMVVCLLTLQTGFAQQPQRHFVPEGEKIRRIPKSYENRSAFENDFSGGRKALESSSVIRDRMVKPASYNDGGARPIRDMATVTTRRPEELPWSYQLKHLSYQEFENKLAQIWGDRLLGNALDQQQRTLRLYLPAGNTAPEASVKFDRVAGLLTYEGAAVRKAGFHQLMKAIDQDPVANPGVKVIDVSMVDAGVVDQVVALYQDEQDDPLSIELPNDIRPQDLDLPNLKGRIRILVNNETNSLIIESTDPDDIVTIRRFIESAKKTGMLEFGSRRVQLFNENAEEVLEKVQALYEGRLQEVFGDVLINSAPSSNSLVIVGKKNSLDRVEKLIRDFDGQPADTVDIVDPADERPLTPREKGYRKFVIEHVSVDEVERAVLALFNQSANNNQAVQPEALPINTYADRRSNTLVVVASQQFIRRAAALIQEMDVPPSEKKAERILRVFKIKNHSAPDFQLILQDTLNGQFQNQATQALSESQLGNNLGNRGVGNAGLQDNQPVVPQTNIRLQRADGSFADIAVDFHDVRINSDAASNTITVVAPQEAMPVISEIIDELDRLPDLFSEVKVIPVINGDASEILATLDQIFNGDGAAGGGGGGGFGNQANSIANLPLQSPGGDGASLINIRFAVNERTNSIIASGSPTDLDFVHNLVRRLDEEDRQDRQTVVYRLSNASVTDVQVTLQEFLDGRNDLNDLNPIFGAGQNNAGVTLARRNISIAVEPTSNQLVVTARPEYFAEIDMLINALDRRPPTIKVKAQIIQVNLNQLENFGVEFGLQDSSIFDADLSDMIGTGFIGLDNPAGQLVSELGVGRMSSNAGVPGFVLSAGDDSLNFILRFLKQKGCANVLFSPEIMTLENLEGRLNQGASIQRPGGVNQVVGAGVTQDVVDVDIGITLAITPRVSPDGMIVMFVDVSNQSLGAEADGTVIGTDAQNNQIISRPINQTVVQTTIMARAGQTVAISGLFQEEKSQVITSVPFLGDLPVIGPLFQSVENQADRSELLIILTPYIVDGEDDLAALNKDDFDRMHWCKTDVAELYGTTSYTGAPYREQARKVYYPDSDPLGQNPVFSGESNTGDAQVTPNGGNEWNGEGEQIFPPTDSGWRRNQGSGSRSPENELNNGSTSRNRLPTPTGSFRGQQTNRTRTVMNQVSNPMRVSRSNREGFIDSERFEAEFDRNLEYVEPPRPTSRNEVRQSMGNERQMQNGTLRRRVIREYPAEPRNASPVYRMNDEANGNYNNFSRR